MEIKSAQRQWGRYYTPCTVADKMIDTLSIDNNINDQAPRILDPACGDGIFLLTLFDRFLNQQNISNKNANQQNCCWKTRQTLLQQHLFGVDVDSIAVQKLRTELLCRIDPPKSQHDNVLQMISANIQIGDALTGTDFSHRHHHTLKKNDSDSVDEQPAPLNWRNAFPGVAANGGFDIVISNPPYLREKYAKPLLDRIAETPFGNRWKEPRMDLWYYFLHRSLDLLKPNGQLSFLVNSYWTASTGARKLIARLQQETVLTDVLLFGDHPIFPSVSGRHLTFQLHRQAAEKPVSEKSSHTATHCRITDFSDVPDLFAALSKTSQKTNQSPTGQPEPHCYRLSQQELFSGGQLRFTQPHASLANWRTEKQLGDIYEIRQGIAENPPFVSRRHCKQFGDDQQFDHDSTKPLRVGEGVFVLTNDELAELKFSPDEQSLLRPYYRPASLKQFAIPPKPTHQLLYLTKKTAPTLHEFPNVQRHLQRFRPILEQRRETRLGKIAWWHLHWPREERLFTQPRIFSVQMGEQPQFIWCDRPAFVGFSVNLLLQKKRSQIEQTEFPAFDLQAITAMLNSTLASHWFQRHAKKRGVHLEINGNVLRTFPLPLYCAETDHRLTKLSQQQHELQQEKLRQKSITTDSNHCVNAEKNNAEKIDQLVNHLYRVNPFGEADNSIF